METTVFNEFFEQNPGINAILVEKMIFNLGVYHKELGFVPFTASKGSASDEVTFKGVKFSPVNDQGYVLDKNGEHKSHLANCMDGYCKFGQHSISGKVEELMVEGKVSLKDFLAVISDPRDIIGRDQTSKGSTKIVKQVIMQEDVNGFVVDLENDAFVIKEVNAVKAGETVGVTKGGYYNKDLGNGYETSYRVVNYKHDVDPSFQPPESGLKRLFKKIF